MSLSPNILVLAAPLLCFAVAAWVIGVNGSTATRSSGLATSAQISRAAGRRALQRRAAILRPSLTGVEARDVGYHLGRGGGVDCWASVDWLAHRGILVAPGSFYGPTGSRHVRVALTATDVAVAAAVARLTS